MLFWPPDIALDTPMPLIAASVLARIRMLRVMGLLPPEPPKPPDPVDVSGKVKSLLRSLAGKSKES